MRACDQRGLSTQQLIKFCSNLFETLHGYYQHKEDFFSTRVGGGGGGHSPKMGQVGGTHPNYFRGWRTVCLVHWLPAWWPLGLPWWPTENAAMLQCYMQSLYLHSALCLLFLCHCCILSEIKLTTTSTTLKLHCTLLKMGELVGGGTHTHWCVCVCGGGGGGGGTNSYVLTIV